MSHEGIRFVDKEHAARETEDNRPLPRIAVTPEKVRVLLTEGKGLEIDWQDGHRSAWTLPGCATPAPAPPATTSAPKRAASPASPSQTAAVLPMYTPPPKPASAHAVGRYAIQFNWQDGHTAGIYSWEYLRRVCQCRECTFAAEETTGTPN
jgi:DUF971 family protein